MSNKIAFDIVYGRARAIQNEAIHLLEPSSMKVPTSVICYAAGRIEELDSSEQAARIACAEEEKKVRALLKIVTEYSSLTEKEALQQIHLYMD